MYVCACPVVAQVAVIYFFFKFVLFQEWFILKNCFLLLLRKMFLFQFRKKRCQDVHQLCCMQFSITISTKDKCNRKLNQSNSAKRRKKQKQNVSFTKNLKKLFFK